MMKIPVFIKDPLVALENPTLGVQEILVRLEKNMGAGPTSSRVVVVDFNADTQTLTDPVVWDEEEGWFHTPLPEKDWLPDAPKVPEDIDDITKVKNPEKYKQEYRQFIEKTVEESVFSPIECMGSCAACAGILRRALGLGPPGAVGFRWQPPDHCAACRVW